MRNSRSIAWATAVLALLVLIGSSWLLGLRIQHFNTLVDRPLYFFLDVGTTEFEFSGRPVEISQDVNDAGEGDLLVSYGESELTIPVGVPKDLPLPLLERQGDWFDVVFFADSERRDFDEFRSMVRSGEIPYRCVLVARYPNTQTDAKLFDVDVEEGDWGYGETMRKGWSFQFHELLPTGGFASKTLRFPESGKSYERRIAKALRADEPIPERSPDELQEYTWEFQAALKVMPRPPAITHERQALRAAGWTLPVASVSVIVLIFSVAFAIAPTRASVEERQK